MTMRKAAIVWLLWLACGITCAAVWAAADEATAKMYYDYSVKKYEKEQNVGAAIEAATAALSSNPDYAEALRWRSFLYVQNEQFGKATADLSRAIELEPKNYVNYYDRGRVYQELGEYSAAIADLGRSIDLVKAAKPDPEILATCYNLRAQLLEKEGKLDEAIRDVSRLIELQPGKWTLYDRRSRLYVTAGEPKKAAADEEKAHKLEIETEARLLIEKLIRRDTLFVNDP
ncbi:MAG: tetratricopeptide repeat protein, partial [Thermoplasmata archaeon]|nr:tetratricopeptide repeat protein [Thermoplasmata archaeon]